MEGARLNPSKHNRFVFFNGGISLISHMYGVFHPGKLNGLSVSSRMDYFPKAVSVFFQQRVNKENVTNIYICVCKFQ